MNLSEPPINMPGPKGVTTSIVDGRSPTFADVAMRLVLDGPVYAIIVVSSILAIRGTATTLEAVVAALAALLSKSWPRPVQMGTHGLLMLLLAVGLGWPPPW